jgi:hypothetical protein
VLVTVSQEKWDKAKRLIGSLWDKITLGGRVWDPNILPQVNLDYKELEITWGFFVHLSMTFEFLTHHLKGFHVALALHLPRQSADGWKLTESE